MSSREQGKHSGWAGIASWRVALFWLMIGFVTAMLVLALSPIMLSLLTNIFDYPETRWNLLSDVGQSFGGVAAVVSAVALLGVVYSVRAQMRQAFEQRVEAVASQQRELIFKGLEKPHLVRIFGPFDDSKEGQQRSERDSYRNLWFIYLYNGYRIGDIAEGSIRHALEHEFFAELEGVKFWEGARIAWGFTATGRRGAKFLKFVDEEKDSALNRLEVLHGATSDRVDESVPRPGTGPTSTSAAG